MLCILLYFAAFLVLCVVMAVVIDRSFRSRGWRGVRTDHFDGVHFANIGATQQDLKRGNIWKWLLTRPKNTWVWRDNPAQAKPAERVEGSNLVVTMVNHATLLIQTEGLNMLTDPIWSKRTSPFEWFGPKRYRAPGIDFDDLPPVDLVLVSHNHYDHMDLRTLRRLQACCKPRIVCGLGNREFLATRGIVDAHELDWWERVTISGVTAVRFVPAQHFSSRALSDRNKTLWGGFVIETPNGNIYFAGDTGYGPFLGSIKERYKSFRLGLIPIGAYIPDFIMRPVHLSPSEAYCAAGELNVVTMVPIHYGTFHLADDQQGQPLKDLKQAMSDQRNGTNVVVLSNGETRAVA